MKSFRQIQHSKSFSKSEIHKLFLKKLLLTEFRHSRSPNPSLYTKYMWVFFSQFSKLSSFTKRRAFCAFSKRSRSIFSKLKINRVTFRELVSFNLLNGFTKAQW